MNKPKLTKIELFSGIGAQKRGVDNTNLYDLEVIATSDVDKEAVVEYSAIHHGLNYEMIENYVDYPSREEMVEELKSRNIGMDFDKGKMYDWEKLIKKKTKDLEKYWLAMKLQNNLGDISKIEQLPTADCWFYSFCCQDISVAGKQKGLRSTCEDCGHEFNPMELAVEERDICPNCGSKNIKGTRSGLLKEVERLLAVAVETNTQPKYLCLENVKNLVGKQFKPDFDTWLERLEELGYNTYWKVLNAKECGIPQNRERVFAFSIRKDIDTGKYTFPIPFDTGLRLKDILEKEVDEKYYINTERAANLIQQLVDKGQLKGQKESVNSTNNEANVSGILVKNQGTEYVKPLEESVTLKARDWKGWDNYGSTAVVEETKLDSSKRLGGLWDGATTHQAGSVWDTNGMSPTLDTAQGGGRMPHIIENNNPQFVIGSTQKNAFVGNGEISSALTSAMGMGGGHVPMVGFENNNNNKKETIWRQLGNTQYKVNNLGIVADTNNKCKVEPFEENGILKIKLDIDGVERVTPVSKLVEKLFPEIIEKDDTLINFTDKDISNEEGKTIVGIKQATKKGYIECEVPGVADFSFPNSTKRRGRVQDGGQTVPTLTAAEGGIRYIESLYRIRKLTVRECFALMGFTFEDWDKCEAIGISNSAGYKAAGNSIVTNCISLLFEHLYKAQYDESYICTDERMQNFHKPQA